MQKIASYFLHNIFIRLLRHHALSAKATVQLVNAGYNSNNKIAASITNCRQFKM